MSRSGFGLLVGWLTEGVGGEASGAGEGFTGERGKRGRASVMRVVNNHLRFDGKLLQLQVTRLFTCEIYCIVTQSNTTSVAPNAWEENTGLLSSLIPQPQPNGNGTARATTSLMNPQAFNSSKGELKLGPLPISEGLSNEAERVLRERSLVERDPSIPYDFQFPRPASIPGVISPTEADLPPHPLNFKTVDVIREVEKVRDGRKKIRLDPSALSNIDPNSPQAGAARARALPSICAYTLHDIAEGYAVPLCLFPGNTYLKYMISQGPLVALFLLIRP